MSRAQRSGSGRNIPLSQRRSEVLQIRCPPETAARARALAADRGLTLAEIVELGIATLEKEPKP